MVGLTGAIIGSFSMMLFASTHFTGVASPGNMPPAVSAAALSGGSDQSRIVSAVHRVSPSVVALNVSVNGQQFVPIDPFSQIFGGQQGPGAVRRYRAKASGSGFVWSKDGLIVTNAHVVRPPQNGTVSSIQVVFQNGDRVPGHVYAVNLAADLALVKVDNYAKLPPPVEIADSDKLEAGQWAIAIGEPFELKQSVSLGVVSGFNRDETIGTENGGAQEFKGLLQTSAPINPGNSGGPLIDVEGRLIGVNQSTANVQAGAQGIGFAIPSNVVKEQIALLEKNPGTHEGTNVGFIGAGLDTLSPDLKVQLNYQGSGVVIRTVAPNSPADQAGLQPGDVIQKVNGRDAVKPDDVISAIRATKPGQAVALNVWSGGTKKLVSVKTIERPADTSSIQQQPDPNQGQDQQP
jgi:serine protease Do